MDRKNFLRFLGIAASSAALTTTVEARPKVVLKETVITKFLPEKFVGPYDKRFRCDVYKITEILKMTKAIQTCLDNKSLDLNEVYVESYNAEYCLLAVVEPRYLDGAFILCRAELVRKKEDYLPYFNSIDPSLFSERDMRDYEYQKTQMSRL